MQANQPQPTDCTDRSEAADAPEQPTEHGQPIPDGGQFDIDNPPATWTDADVQPPEDLPAKVTPPVIAEAIRTNKTLFDVTREVGVAREELRMAITRLGWFDHLTRVDARTLSKGEVPTLEDEPEQDNRVGPVIFSNARARERLEDHGSVVTFRTSDRTTGDTHVRYNRTGAKQYDCTIRKLTRVNEGQLFQRLAEYHQQAGFDSAEDWLDAIQDLHGHVPDKGYLYRVVLPEEYHDALRVDGGRLRGRTHHLFLGSQWGGLADENTQEWGLQSAPVLTLALAEELAEVATELEAHTEPGADADADLMADRGRELLSRIADLGDEVAAFLEANFYDDAGNPLPRPERENLGPIHGEVTDPAVVREELDDLAPLCYQLAWALQDATDEEAEADG